MTAASANEARVAVRSGPLAEAVLSRVVGMLAARALCPIDRLDDTLLVSDALAAHAPKHTLDGRVSVTVTVDADAIVLAVEGLRPQGAAALLADAELPGVGNVIERVADDVSPQHSSDGSSDELRVRVAFASSATTV